MLYSRNQLLIVTMFLLLAIAPWVDARAERIRDYQVDLNLAQDGLLKVTETIKYDLEKSQRNAIYRRVPLQYQSHGHWQNITVLPISVKEQLSRAGKVITRAVPFTCKNMGGFANLNIGDKVISGQHLYRIRYDVASPVNFSSIPEFYWDCLGREWHCPIDNLHVVLHLPPGQKSAVSTALKTAHTQSGSVIQFAAKNLKPGQGFPISVSLPTFPRTGWANILLQIELWKDAIIAPAITLALLFIFWFFFGRDPVVVKASATAGLPWLPPLDLTPAELGTLIDEHCDKYDVTATILDLAARGYLIITEIPYNGIIGLSNKDYIFKKAASPDPGRLKAHEVLLLSSMFVANDKTLLSVLRGNYKEFLDNMRNLIYLTLVDDKYFARLPQRDRDYFAVIGALMLSVGAMLLAGYYFHGDLYLDYGTGFSISGMLIMAAGCTMPKRTAKGVLALGQAEAFKRFVWANDKVQLTQISKQDPGVFARLLPYAAVLGCAEQWAFCFKDLLAEAPDFFRVRRGEIEFPAKFDSAEFTYDLARSMRTITSALDSLPLPNYNVSTRTPNNYNS